MNTRLIISLLCAGALAFACGPRSGSDAPVALASMLPISSKPAVERPRRVSNGRAEVKLSSHLKVDVGERAVRFLDVVLADEVADGVVVLGAAVAGELGIDCG